MEITRYQVAFYDLTRYGKCFDETFFKPDEVDQVLDYVNPNLGNHPSFTTRVFVHFSDGRIFELTSIKE